MVYLTQEGDKPKYNSLTSFMVTALKQLIRKERRELEDQGVVWEHLSSKFDKTQQQEEVV